MQKNPIYRQSRLYLRKRRTLHHVSQVLLTLLLLSTIATLLNACSSGDPQSQQQANQNRALLDQKLHYAQTIGTPRTDLKPVLDQV
ncbi:MAG: hypothetical protein JO215_04145, partial [Ktedonobacteraceae bacterium]|nr:hypothetical protein [Ktedonobacteraceae bacterium]